MASADLQASHPSALLQSEAFASTTAETLAPASPCYAKAFEHSEVATFEPLRDGQESTEPPEKQHLLRSSISILRAMPGADAESIAGSPLPRVFQSSQPSQDSGEALPQSNGLPLPQPIALPGDGELQEKGQLAEYFGVTWQPERCPSLTLNRTRQMLRPFMCAVCMLCLEPALVQVLVLGTRWNVPVSVPVLRLCFESRKLSDIVGSLHMLLFPSHPPGSCKAEAVCNCRWPLGSPQRSPSSRVRCAVGRLNGGGGRSLGPLEESMSATFGAGNGGAFGRPSNSIEAAWEDYSAPLTWEELFSIQTRATLELRVGPRQNLTSMAAAALQAHCLSLMMCSESWLATHLPNGCHQEATRYYKVCAVSLFNPHCCGWTQWGRSALEAQGAAQRAGMREASLQALMELIARVDASRQGIEAKVGASMACAIGNMEGLTKRKAKILAAQCGSMLAGRPARPRPAVARSTWSDGTARANALREVERGMRANWTERANQLSADREVRPAPSSPPRVSASARGPRMTCSFASVMSDRLMAPGLPQ